MLFGRKLLSVLALAFAMVAFDTGAAAQEAPKTDNPDSVRKERMRRESGRPGMRRDRGRRGMDRRHGRHGRGGMRGRRGGMGGQRGFMGGPGRGFAALNLNDSQKQQMQSLLEKQRAGGNANQEEMRKLMMVKRSGLMTAAQETRFKALQDQRKAAGEQFKQSFLGILNPEQRKQIEDRDAKRKSMMEQRKKGMEERKMRMEEHRKKMQENKPAPEDG